MSKEDGIGSLIAGVGAAVLVGIYVGFGLSYLHLLESRFVNVLESTRNHAEVIRLPIKEFEVKGTEWKGKRIESMIKYDKIFIYNDENKLVPLKEALLDVTEEDGQKDLVKKFILQGYVD